MNYIVLRVNVGILLSPGSGSVVGLVLFFWQRWGLVVLEFFALALHEK